MKQIKGPDYIPDFLHGHHTPSKKSTPNFSAVKLDYDGDYPLMNLDAFDDGIDYLNQLPYESLCTNAPGACGDISCSYDTAILWCNDAEEGVNEHHCNVFGRYAKWIHDHWTPKGRGKSLGANLYARLIDDNEKLEVKVSHHNCKK